MEECSLDALIFAWDHPEDFSKISCQRSFRPSKILIAFRFIGEIYGWAVCIWLFCRSFLTPRSKVFCSYFIWAHLLWCGSIDFSFPLALKGLRTIDPDLYGTSLPWYAKVYWALFSATLPTMVVSVVVYWTQIYNETLDVLYIFMGNVTPLLSLIEFGLVAFPLRILYFFFFIFFMIFYISITLIFYAVEAHKMNCKRCVYKDLNWTDPKRAVLSCLIMILIGQAAYFIFWVISRLKYYKYNKRREPL